MFWISQLPSGPNPSTHNPSVVPDHNSASYGACVQHLKSTDEDPNNSDNVILIYKQISISKEDFASDPSQNDFWNREHVWPKSHGDFGPNGNFETPAFTDVHNLKPADASMNSFRNDKDFDMGGNVVMNGNITTACFSTNATFEPRDDVKGDIARIIFYMDDSII